MTGEDESERLAYGRADVGLDERALSETLLLPPLEIPLDDLERRQNRLAEIVGRLIIPQLISLHEKRNNSPLRDHAADIAELARLVIGPDNEDAANFILRLKDAGVSLDQLHLDLLEPAAHHLGELWQEDRIDFVDVTLGVAKLQKLVHVFEELDQVAPYDDKRKVLMVTPPGEQHSLGSIMVQKFLRAGGWYVLPCAPENMEDAARLAAEEWFAVAGLSVNADAQLSGLALAIGLLRRTSLNPSIKIMVGGSAIQRNPSAVAQIGADGTAASGPAAVVLAKKLLAASLTA